MTPAKLRHGWPLYALLGAALLLTGVTLDAVRRNAAAEERVRLHGALTTLLGTSDLALSSSSRWLRHPSLVEPAAAAADAPAVLDTDPAGALIPPQPRLLGQSARGLRSIPNTRSRQGASP